MLHFIPCYIIAIVKNVFYISSDIVFYIGYSTNMFQIQIIASISSLDKQWKLLVCHNSSHFVRTYGLLNI